ncbi:L-lysine 2,3-aminomutase [Chlamydiales bacterium SCGC AB-751-O23]|jgi:lysine 2,3-aminomutase|nr:L-lysine 2,3-aminomutase [Chlamydiales bacterium SCGC AB-751-O23]
MPPVKEAPLWRKIQKNNFVKLDSLADFLQLSPEKKLTLKQKQAFPLNIPKRLAEKIEKNSLHDPIFLQFVSTENKSQSILNSSKDPVKDSSFQKTPYLLHKYQGRVLFLPTGACAMHCRYCFRQNFNYQPSNHEFSKEKDYLQKDSSIHEVILSGGDPLSLSNQKLHSILSMLNSINHLEIIRFHTRFPIGIPERIDSDFLKMLKNSCKQIIFIVHINHPEELDKDVSLSLKRIQSLGIPVLCQSVLLKGVNDNIHSLKDLFLKLAKNGIIPYYLHMLDLVDGSESFFVEEERASSLVLKLRETLPGYAVPQLVREVPYKPYKTPVY